jgi:hypothetical protein
MTKLYATARVLAVLLAIVAAFATIPYASALLVVFGAVSVVGNTADQNSRTYLSTLVLLAGAATLGGIPQVGSYLASIFGGLGTAGVGA